MLKEFPEDALGCHRFAGMVKFLFYACFEVCKFFLMFSGLFGGVCHICGHVRRPPIGGSASANVISGVVPLYTNALANLFYVSLYSTYVCAI